MTAPQRLLALMMLGAVLVGAAWWTRRRADPHRYDALPRAQLEALVAERPGDGDALYAMARLYRKEGQVADAKQALERVQRVDPTNAPALNDLGELKAGTGDLPGAQLLFQQAAQLRPDLPEPHRNLGSLAGIARNYVLAIEQYRRALSLRPDDPRTLSSLGSAYADALNRGEAEAAFKKAIALLDHDPALRMEHGAETYQRYGLALFKLRDLAGARGILEQAANLGPLDADTHLFLGLTLAQQPRNAADQDTALKELDQASQLGYKGGEDDYGRGLIFVRRRQQSKAIPALETAVRLDAGGDDARYQLGRAYLAVGQAAKGEALLAQFQRLRATEPEVKRLRHAVGTQPQDVALHRRLAKLCLDTGRYREALQQFRALQSLGVADAEVLRGMQQAAQAVGEMKG